MKQTTTMLIVALCVICAMIMSGCLEVDDPVNVDNVEVTEIKTIPEDDATSVSQTTSQTPELTTPQSLVDKYMNSVKSKYDKAQFDQSYMRDSDGFKLYYDDREMEYRKRVCTEDGSWKVITRSRYPAYGTMLDDENHGFTVWVDHMATIRNAHNKMTKGYDVTVEYSHYYSVLETPNYGDQAYKTVQPGHSNSENTDEITGYSANIFILKDKTIGRIWISGYSDPNECEEVIDYYASILADVVDNIE